MSDPRGAAFPWHPKPCEELSATVECNGFDVNEKPALVCVMPDAADAKKAELSAVMAEIGAEVSAAGKASEDGEPEMIFFTATSNDGPVKQVKSMTGAPAKGVTEPTLLLLDIPDEDGFYVTEKDVLDAATIREFLASWKSGALKSAGERKQLG